MTQTHFQKSPVIRIDKSIGALGESLLPAFHIFRHDIAGSFCGNMTEVRREDEQGFK